MFLVLLATLTGSVDGALRQRIAALPHNPGPYCLGALDTVVLTGSFERGTRRISQSAREITIATAPRSGGTWLAATLEQTEYVHTVHTTHYPFFEPSNQPLGTNPPPGGVVVLLVRNPFDAHRSYTTNLAALNQRSSTHWPALSLDAFTTQWAKHNHYWMTRGAILINYEHLLADPVGVSSFSFLVDLALRAQTRPPPHFVVGGPCANALVDTNRSTVDRIAANHNLKEYGYSVVRVNLVK